MAQEIFGRGRRASTPNNGNRKLGSGPSLASRVGIAKVRYQASRNAKCSFAPASSDTREKASQRPNFQTQRSLSSAPRLNSNGTLPAKETPKTITPRAAQQPRPAASNPMIRSARSERRNERLFDAATHTEQENGNGDGLSIRGLAGPYVVIGQNFAPGTTAADIESAMVPSGGDMISCRIISSSPTVIAEMVFAEKYNAETVISKFNNMKVNFRDFLEHLMN